MSAGWTAAALAAGYLLGSVPFGVLLTRLLTGKDVRTVGSGNIGASNVARAAGKKAGVLTLLLDAAKAALPMLAARALAPDRATGQTFAVIVGLAAFAGHLYPVWLGFKGGKGVATALGVFLVLAPLPALVALAAFGVAYGLTRIPAVGSLAGTAVCCAGTFAQELAIHGREAWGSPVPWAGLSVGLVIVWRHRANIARLVRGTENRV